MSLKKYTISGFKMTTDQANSVEEGAKLEKCERERSYEQTRTTPMVFDGG